MQSNRSSVNAGAWSLRKGKLYATGDALKTLSKARARAEMRRAANLLGVAYDAAPASASLLVTARFLGTAERGFSRRARLGRAPENARKIRRAGTRRLERTSLRTAWRGCSPPRRL